MSNLTYYSEPFLNEVLACLECGISTGDLTTSEAREIFSAWVGKLS